MDGQDFHDFFSDHLDTLNSIITSNGYINDRIPKDYKNLNTQGLINYLKTKFDSYNISITSGDVTKNRHLLSGIFEHSSKNRVLYVYFCLASAVEIKNVQKDTLLQLKNKKYQMMEKDIIIVTEKEISHASRKSIYSDDLFNVKTFTDDTFFDISDNIFVPKFLNKYNKNDPFFEGIDTKKFPKIVLDDPLCSFYLCKVGDILELERDVDVDGITDTQIVYRTVIDRHFGKKEKK